MRSIILLAAAVALSGAAFAQQTPGAPNPCTLFKPAEISTYLGEAVENGERDTLTTSCSWYAKDEDSDSFAMFTIWPKKEIDQVTQNPPYKAHPELGEGGFTIKDYSVIGSWTGGFVAGDLYYRAFLNGPRATEAQTIAWLKAMAARRGGGAPGAPSGTAPSGGSAKPIGALCDLLDSRPSIDIKTATGAVTTMKLKRRNSIGNCAYEDPTTPGRSFAFDEESDAPYLGDAVALNVPPAGNRKALRVLMLPSGQTGAQAHIRVGSQYFICNASGSLNPDRNWLAQFCADLYRKRYPADQ